MNTTDIYLTRTVASVAKALLPVIKNKDNINQGLEVLTRVSISEGYLYATDRYVAIKIPLTEFLLPDEDAQKLEGRYLSLQQVEALTKVKPSSAPVVLKVTEDAITLDTWDGVQITHNDDGSQFPAIAQFFTDNGNKDLSHVSQSVSLTTTLTKIAAAVKATRILWQPSSKSTMLNVTLEGAKINIDVVSVNNVLKVN